MSRPVAIAVALLAAGTAVGAASADVVPTLPVSTPTLPVQVPPLPAPPLPAPPLPKLPATPSVPASAPKAPAVPGTPQIAGIASTGSPAGGSSSGGSGSPSIPSSGSPRQAQMSRLRSSRPWISAEGPKANRRTTLTFRLAQAARVVFTVTQVSPVCRLAGTFTVRGHAGLNKVPFKGRLRGRPLPSGTYRISARTRGGGMVFRVTVVIVESGAPSPTELETAKRSNVCGARAALASTRLSGTAATAASERPRTKRTAPTKSGSTNGGGVASASSTHTSPFSPARVSQKVTNPLVIAALAAAILLLGLAALPKEAIPDPRLTEALARYRLEVAAAGVAALGAAIVALVLA